MSVNNATGWQMFEARLRQQYAISVGIYKLFTIKMCMNFTVDKFNCKYADYIQLLQP